MLFLINMIEFFNRSIAVKKCLNKHPRSIQKQTVARDRILPKVSFAMDNFQPKAPTAGAARQRRKIIAAWRKVDLHELEGARKNPAATAAELIPKVISKLGLAQRRSEVEIVKVWNRLIDPTIVAHAQPTGINKGTLFVTVDNSVWLEEIVRYRRREILQRLQFAFGKELILKISYRIG